MVLFAAAAALAAALGTGPNSATVWGLSPTAHAESSPLAIRITSPLGRTGATGAIRIVAQVNPASDAPVAAVRFFVDNVLLGETRKGPPWGIDWTDENPFEAREIRAEALDASGHTAVDSVRLKPLELIEHAQVSSVYVETSVQDKTGRFVTGIGPSGFQLFEDDVPQTLDVVRPEQLPATFTILIDTSQSMARRIDFVRDAASRMASYLREKDRIIVAPFAKKLQTITGPTDDRTTVSDAIAAIRPGGGTAILDSVEEAAKLISQVEGRHAIILLTDGYDEHSTATLTDAISMVQQTGASMYVVGIGGVAGISLRGERFLRQLASDTGGRAFFPSSEIELRQIHELVASEVTLRYVLTYMPNNQKVDGSWRRIAVKTVDPTLKVRARTGYFAPKPPPVRPSIEFTLTDTSQSSIDMTMDDLEVVEDGVPQSLEAFQEATTPVSIVFTVDQSGSMKKATEPLKAAAKSFIEQVRPEDSLALMLFSDRSQFAHDLTTRRDWSLEAIDQVHAERRYRALRRRLRLASAAEGDRRAPCHRRDDGRA